jgi:hypothetical protein
MSDLPPLQIGKEKKQAIFDAINANMDFPEPALPSDVTTEDVMAEYHINRNKARDIMRKMVEKYPERYAMVQAILPETYHNRPGYVIRLVEPQVLSVSRPELYAPLPVALTES